MMKGNRWIFLREFLLLEGIVILLAILWYDNLFWVLILQWLWMPYLFYRRKMLRDRKKRQYEKGFYDFLQSILPSLQAGYSLENACTSAYDEILQLNGPEDAFVGELQRIVQGIRIHLPLELLFYEMAERSGNDDIHQFSVVLEILKYMGGNSVEVLRRSMLRIQKKMETSQEIRTMLSGKVYEKNLMLFMPFFMMAYLRMTNASYLQPLYHTLPGQGLLTISLLGILACFFWGEYLMDSIRSY